MINSCIARESLIAEAAVVSFSAFIVSMSTFQQRQHTRTPLKISVLGSCVVQQKCCLKFSELCSEGLIMTSISEAKAVVA